MGKIVIVNDLMQENYSYEYIEPIGKNFDLEFKPELTPKEMLNLGVFGGRYMRDCINEFPKDWFINAKFHPANTPGHSPYLNYFGIDASQSLYEWKIKGWLYKDDPRGWFQWYCRYYMGRRIPDEDARQIQRWKNYKRHITQLKINCPPGAIDCRKNRGKACYTGLMTVEIFSI